MSLHCAVTRPNFLNVPSLSFPNPVTYVLTRDTWESNKQFLMIFLSSSVSSPARWCSLVDMYDFKRLLLLWRCNSSCFSLVRRFVATCFSIIDVRLLTLLVLGTLVHFFPGTNQLVWPLWTLDLRTSFCLHNGLPWILVKGFTHMYTYVWHTFFCPGIRSTWFLENQVNPFWGPCTSN